MKALGTTMMLASAVVFLTALFLLTAGHFSLLWVILLIIAPGLFLWWVSRSLPGLVRNICQLTRDWHSKNVKKRDAQLGLG